MSSAEPSGFLKDRVLAIRAPSTPSAFAASSTVAEETVNSITRSSIPNCLKYARPLSMDISFFASLSNYLQNHSSRSSVPSPCAMARLSVRSTSSMS